MYVCMYVCMCGVCGVWCVVCMCVCVLVSARVCLCAAKLFLEAWGRKIASSAPICNEFEIKIRGSQSQILAAKLLLEAWNRKIASCVLICNEF